MTLLTFSGVALPNHALLETMTLLTFPGADSPSNETYEWTHPCNADSDMTDGDIERFSEIRQVLCCNVLQMKKKRYIAQWLERRTLD